jgi:hypothetical protein
MQATKTVKNMIELPDVPPVLPPSPPCLVPGCPRPQDLRGLCARCYTHASQLVGQGLTSWATLEAAGKALPKAPNGPSDLPHRKAWFLGEWAPMVSDTGEETPDTGTPTAGKGKGRKLPRKPPITTPRKSGKASGKGLKLVPPAPEPMQGEAQGDGQLAVDA